jgi:MFS transporter, MHS family, proline/betaine transporter
MSTAIPSPPKRASGAVQVAAATIGNALEWFDILIYGYFAQTISGVFFPNHNPAVSLLITFGSFGLSYVARPVGAVVLGAYADKRGRKVALTLSIQLMVLGTAIMALMPSYARVGLIAPISIFAARLMQGFAVAGEFGSSTAFLIEHSARRKAFYASFQFFGQHVAKLLASLFGYGLYKVLHPQQLQSWGWRVPFIFGLLVGPVGMYIRRKVDETPEFLTSTHSRSPIRETFATEKMSLVLGSAVVAGGTAAVYFSIYVPTYAVTQLHLAASAGFVASIVISLVAMLLIPLAAMAADQVGCVRLLLPATIVRLVTFYPLFLVMTRWPGMPTLLGALIFDDVLTAIYVAALPAVLASLFPPRTRVTGISLSYNLGVTLFGGFALAIFTWLIEVTHNKTAPSFYLIATTLVTLAGVVAVKLRRQID